MSATAPEAGGSSEIDFARLSAEINEEVRRRRAAGDFPPNLERELDELFARFSPMGRMTGGFEDALEQAELSGFIHADVPTESRRPGVAVVKRLLRKLFAWYAIYLAQQTTAFASSVTRALRLLGARVRTLEEATPAANPRALAEARAAAAAAEGAAGDNLPWLDWAASALTGATGRVLHAECGTGQLVAALLQAGLDAYGVEPDEELALDASRRALDVRADDALTHLRALPDDFLGGIVLSGCVDRLPLPAQLEVLDLAVAKLSPGARLVLVGTAPETWSRLRSPVAADLAPGRPLHPETWQHLLASRGLASGEVARWSTGEGLELLPDDAPQAAVLNPNLELLNRALFEPASFGVIATRP